MKDMNDAWLLLVHEKKGFWALPGGWCDVDQSIATNVKKKVLEETGCQVHVRKVIVTGQETI